MTNKELQTWLNQFPDDVNVVFIKDSFDRRYTEIPDLEQDKNIRFVKHEEYYLGIYSSDKIKKLKNVILIEPGYCRSVVSEESDYA